MRITIIEGLLLACLATVVLVSAVAEFGSPKQAHAPQDPAIAPVVYGHITPPEREVICTIANRKGVIYTDREGRLTTEETTIPCDYNSWSHGFGF